MIPLGTGMDFARSNGIPRKLDAAIDAAHAGKTVEIDAGRVSYRAWDGSDGDAYFANIASAGMSGAVARQANVTTKALGGRVSFFAALVRVFATLAQHRARGRSRRRAAQRQDDEPDRGQRPLPGRRNADRARGVAATTASSTSS